MAPEKDTVPASSEIPRRFDMVWLAIAAVSLVSLAVFAERWSRNGFFWDLSVYRRAVADFGRGVDPYRTDVYFPVVYHPLVLRFFVLLNDILPLKAALPLLELAALAWFAFEFARAPLRLEGPGSAPEPRIVAIVAAGAFGGIGVPALLSGNITSFMHFALIASLLYSKRVVGAWPTFTPYAMICLFALIKPYFLLYLAVLVLLAANRRIALVRSAAVVLIAAATWLSFDWLKPAEYAHFMRALRSATLDTGDLGYTFFGVLNPLVHNYFLALALHGAVCLLLLVAALLVLARTSGRETAFTPWLFVTYLVVTLANPRMKDYDLFPALAGFLLAVGLAPRRAALGTLAGLLLSLVPLLAPLFHGLSVQHPLLFDPYGTWQDVGLVVIGLVYWFRDSNWTPRVTRSRNRGAGSNAQP